MGEKLRFPREGRGWAKFTISGFVEIQKRPAKIFFSFLIQPKKGRSDQALISFILTEGTSFRSSSKCCAE